LLVDWLIGWPGWLVARLVQLGWFGEKNWWKLIYQKNAEQLE
jgi:hypothetical protein